MGQLQLPLSFEDFIPENHLVRVVNTFIDNLELKPLYDRYKEGGRPAYHPRMMLKVMIYSFSQKTYSSHQIAKAFRENIIEVVFYEVVRLLIDKKYIKLQNYF